MKFTGDDTDMFLNWRQGWEDGDKRYIVQLAGQALVDLSRLQDPGPGHFSVAPTSKKLAEDRWHFFELGTFDGVTDLWVNGKLLASYTDPQPLPAGTIGLETHLFEGAESVFYFDNIAVCELSAAFESVYEPAK